jgi:hypothetical protein
VLDLIAIANYNRYRNCHRIKSRTDILDHAAFSPGSFSGGCAAQCVFDHLLAKLR